MSSSRPSWQPRSASPAVDDIDAILRALSAAAMPSIRTGVVRAFNDRYLGMSETEKVALQVHPGAPPPTPLTELFEDVHILIFIVMALFILNTAILLEAELDNALSFFGLRERFHGRHTNIFVKTPDEKEITFSQYLRARVGHTVVEFIELPTSMLITVIAIAITARPLLELSGVPSVTLMVVLAFALLAAASALHLSFYRTFDYYHRPDKTRLKNWITSDVAEPDQTVFVSRLDEERPVISHWLCGKVNRTAAVLPLASVKATTFLVQLTLFLLSAYTALLLKAVISTSHGSRGLWWFNGLWAYPLTFLPVGLSAMVLASAVGLFTMITSLDFLTDTDTIDTLMADIDAQRLARQTQILAFIRNKANTAAKEDRNKRARAVSYFERLPRDVQDAVVSAFAALSDTRDESGGMDLEGFYETVRSFGLAKTSPDAKYYARVLFETVDDDRSGKLELREFQTVFVMAFFDYEDPSTRAEREKGALRVFFDSIDADRSGEISIDELAKGLSELRPPVTASELTDLMAAVTSEEQVKVDVLTEFVQRVAKKDEMLHGGH
ncbi:unnamed protein product [Vitrella brassicaformis CCMP3155]|uniref:EF-hand domain-containing protein n=1 Tax=Vitrella brassicaformis (strain CCMP3155) TaxID=1169540 RepID=A0A0G4FN78_VITBC|nr:unnamed protein product [Vitrella brassicaformis CCMP3155]|eukprot:CEM15699.1 unnamed protein product [Vitrella brassicaformis CCMP3155]